MNDQQSAADNLDSDLQSTATNPAAAAQLTNRELRAVPAIIGAYRVLAMLGEGGMGTVYQAEQQNPHRIVALKVIKQGISSDLRCVALSKKPKRWGACNIPEL